MNTINYCRYLKVALILSTGSLQIMTHADQQEKKPRYKLIDLSTFGGARSAVGFGSRYLSNRGTLVGAADTPAPDPNFDAVANYFGFLAANSFIEHAFKIQH